MVNYKSLICWLMNNTRINNDCSITNRELVKSFLIDYPEFKLYNNRLSFKVGQIINLLYGDDLSAERGGGLPIII